MTTFDISPLMRSTAIDFDRAWNQLSTTLHRDGNGSGSSPPSYNLLRLDDENYQIAIEVPGFSRDQIEVETSEGSLWIRGNRDIDLQHNQYLYRGIDRQSFERSFQLPEHVTVSGARLEAGILHVDLLRELPEAMKPQRIEVTTEDQVRPVLESRVKAA